MTVPYRWPEHEMVEKEYPRRGAHWIAKQTGRSVGGVHNYVRQHKLELGDMANYVRISELARLTNQDVYPVWQRAVPDKVIRRIRAATEARGTLAAVVPLKWADDYVAEIAARVQGQALRDTQGWLSTIELAKLFKVGKGTVVRGINGKGVLAGHLEGVRRARGMQPGVGGGNWLVHPDDAKRIAQLLDADRQKAKTLVSTKSLAVECGVKQSYAAAIGAELGGELLFVHGRHMRFVTPKAAKAMRRRFRETAERRAYEPHPDSREKRCEWCGELFARRLEPYEGVAAFNRRKSCGGLCGRELARANRAANRAAAETETEQAPELKRAA